MPNRFGLILLIALALFITNCAKKTMVVLVPDPDGTVGSVTVSNQAGSVTMDSANQATTVRGQTATPSTPVNLEETQIDQVFSEAMSIQPLPPVHFILYFEKNATALTPDSAKRLPDILRAVQERNAADISVVGHTDTAGDVSYNMRLSKRRAQAVADQLIEKGVDQSIIHTTSHGEENPLIKTADNVSEPRNRRVEVVVR
jgi:outer membrane protein OmpA-like peptidoglycan-associated protein